MFKTDNTIKFESKTTPVMVYKKGNQFYLETPKAPEKLMNESIKVKEIHKNHFQTQALCRNLIEKIKTSEELNSTDINFINHQLRAIERDNSTFESVKTLRLAALLCLENTRMRNFDAYKKETIKTTLTTYISKTFEQKKFLKFLLLSLIDNEAEDTKDLGSEFDKFVKKNDTTNEEFYEAEDFFFREGFVKSSFYSNLKAIKRKVAEACDKALLQDREHFTKITIRSTYLKGDKFKTIIEDLIDKCKVRCLRSFDTKQATYLIIFVCCHIAPLVVEIKNDQIYNKLLEFMDLHTNELLLYKFIFKCIYNRRLTYERVSHYIAKNCETLTNQDLMYTHGKFKDSSFNGQILGAQIESLLTQKHNILTGMGDVECPSFDLRINMEKMFDRSSNVFSSYYKSMEMYERITGKGKNKQS